MINVKEGEPLIETELLSSLAKFCSENESLEMTSVKSPMESATNITDSKIVGVLANKDRDAITFSRAPIPFCRGRSLADRPVESYSRLVGIYACRTSVIKKIPPESKSDIEKLEQLHAICLACSISMMSWANALHGGIDKADSVE